jgi:hypothetical protein
VLTPVLALAAVVGWQRGVVAALAGVVLITAG